MEKTQDEFDKYYSEVSESVDAVKKKIRKERESRSFVSFGNYPLEKLKIEIAGIVKEALNICDPPVYLSNPPAHIYSDFSLGVFDLAKILGEKPNIVAKKIADSLVGHKTDLVKDAFVAGPFVNVETQKKTLYREVLSNIIELGGSYGENNVNAGKTVIIDYSAPNIAKPIGVGHLRSTIIGQALANIYYATGCAVIKDNHVGDWGTQFGALIYAYQEWGDEDKIVKDPIGELKDLYVKFHQFSEDHPDAKDKARELFARLEGKDSEMVALWKRFRDLSLKDFKRVYERLGIEFDTSIGESYFTDQADELVDDCLIKEFCRKDKSSGAVVVDEIGELPSFLLRKQDGSSLYLTRDLATLQFRINEFRPDTILYVVGSEQELNFKQMFAFAKRAGYLLEGTQAKHIGFGMVLVGGKKMSTRKGTLIELEELISQSVSKSREILVKKNPDIDLEDLNKIAEIIGIGAILYNDLSQSRTKNISFDWDKMLNLEGGSAVYLQYTYARINSILRKVAETHGEIGSVSDKKEITFESKNEFDLARKLMMFPDVVLKAQESDSPHHICVYLEELALIFNSFYNETSILKTEDQKLRNSRVALSKSVATVIKKGLSLLNIKVPEKI